MSRIRYWQPLLFGCGIAVVLGTSGIAAAAARVVSDLPYESPGGKRNFLNVYLPDKGIDPQPVTVLLIHGGGWYAGDKSDHVLFHTKTADAGYPVVACNYTLSSRGGPAYPQAVYDVKAVVRWIREQGGKYDLPPAIVAVGFSAGGHLALMLGTTAGVETFEPLPAPPGGYAVNAVVSFFSPCDLVFQMESDGDHEAVEQFLGAKFSGKTRNNFKVASPITYVSDDDAPTVLHHGRLDLVVPLENSVRMHAALTKAGVFSKLTIVENTGHGLGGGFGGRSGVSRLVTEAIPTLLAAKTPTTAPSPPVTPQSGATSCGAGAIATLLLLPLVRCGASHDRIAHRLRACRFNL